MNIQEDIYYTPREIEKYKLILSGKKKSSYNWVLSKIKSGELKAENHGKGKTPYFVIKGSELLKYRKKHNYFVDSEQEKESK